MPDYVLLTTGHGTMPQGEGMTAFMAAWNAWVADLGAALKDGGNPIMAARTIDPSRNVRTGSDVDVSGYCIITAGSMDEAVDKAKGCPALDTGTSISVLETVVMGAG